MSELRCDPILRRWVIISDERTYRPSDYRYRSERRTSGGFCPFCPGHEYTTPPEILVIRAEGTASNGPGWSLRVVPNKFPALRIEEHISSGQGDGLFRSLEGLGAHEVIIETPDHESSMATLPVSSIGDVLRAYRDRTLDLARDDRLRYVTIFKNHGPSAGATLEHTHTQLIALPVVPRQIVDEMEGSLAYHSRTGSCVYCEIVRLEREEGRRLILENEHFVALSPFAAPFPFESWILPKRHASLFENSSMEFPALALILRDLLQRMGRHLGDPDYNFVLHTAPLRDGENPYYHWHMEVVPRVSRAAGFEWGTGFTINTTSPEEAASQLRDLGP